jgi:hypothetical protein
MTPEQQGLLDKALRSLQAAIGLNEGFAEFATSRAYYAMFYVSAAAEDVFSLAVSLEQEIRQARVSV